MFKRNMVLTAILRSSLHSQSYAAKFKRLFAPAEDLILGSVAKPGGPWKPLLSPRLLGEYFPSFALLGGEYLLLGEHNCPSSQTPIHFRARFALSLKRPPVARYCLRAACARNVCFGFALPYAWRSEVRQKSSMGKPSERSSF